MNRHFAAIAIGVGLAASSLLAPAFAADQTANTATVPTPDYARAMERYERLLRRYEKDQAAYEADPGTWTAEVPSKPDKPAVAPVVEQSATRG
jgi:hypothetical protein